MRTTQGLVFAFVSLLGVGACSSSATGTGSGGGGYVQIDPETLCDRVVVECRDPQTTMLECRQAFTVSRVSKECADKLPTATCAELIASNSATFDLCFPKCSGGARTCNADGTITACDENGRTHHFACEAVCAQADTTYSGSCSANCGGRGSPDGQPQCCCR